MFPMMALMIMMLNTTVQPMSAPTDILLKDISVRNNDDILKYYKRCFHLYKYVLCNSSSLSIAVYVLSLSCHYWYQHQESSAVYLAKIHLWDSVMAILVTWIKRSVFAWTNKREVATLIYAKNITNSPEDLFGLSFKMNSFLWVKISLDLMPSS